MLLLLSDALPINLIHFSFYQEAPYFYTYGLFLIRKEFLLKLSKTKYTQISRRLFLVFFKIEIQTNNRDLE